MAFAQRGRVGGAVRVLACFAGLYLLWLLLVGSTDPVELAGGVLGAAIAVFGWHVVCSRDELSLALRAQWFIILARRLPWHTLADCGRVLSVLWRRAKGEHVRGTIKRVPFDPGDSDDPYALARRALVVAGVSVAPNAVVVRIDGRDLILHELVPTRQTVADPKWPL
ncbi:MAG TPA: hypothetical protein VGQ62_11630 [Chloroflexota bacterium]|jgi:multisubunit Na+/H+ antiporter MnhE subunit|nr:hypothetical protein [Chloroflexota bacterium]